MSTIKIAKLTNQKSYRQSPEYVLVFLILPRWLTVVTVIGWWSLSLSSSAYTTLFLAFLDGPFRWGSSPSSSSDWICFCLKGRLRRWEDLNVAALTRLRPRMTAENRRIFGLFCKARHEQFLSRATLFAKTGVYRQTFLGNLGLVAAVMLNKIWGAFPPYAERDTAPFPAERA